MVTVEYHHNNSGGRDWLDPKDWQALQAAGWVVLVFGKPYDGAWASEASKQFPSLQDGIDEWVRITGEYPGAEGCPCCGPPHSFTAYDENGDDVDSFSDYDYYVDYDDWADTEYDEEEEEDE